MPQNRSHCPLPLLASYCYFTIDEDEQNYHDDDYNALSVITINYKRVMIDINNGNDN